MPPSGVPPAGPPHIARDQPDRKRRHGRAGNDRADPHDARHPLRTGLLASGERRDRDARRRRAGDSGPSPPPAGGRGRAPRSAHAGRGREARNGGRRSRRPGPALDARHSRCRRCCGRRLHSGSARSNLCLCTGLRRRHRNPTGNQAQCRRQQRDIRSTTRREVPHSFSRHWSGLLAQLLGSADAEPLDAHEKSYPGRDSPPGAV